MNQTTDLSESTVTDKSPATFDLSQLTRELDLVGKNIKDINLSTNPDIETPELMTEYRELAKNMLDSMKRDSNIPENKPAINFWARILIKLRIGS